MATTKTQRLVNLVLCLRSTREYLSADQIRHSVQGYEDCASDEAFLRRFERDKRALRDVGVPIDQGNSSAAGSPVGYRIAPRDYELPEITLTPEQAGVLAVAAEVWRAGERSAQVDGALTKLRAAGVDPVQDHAPGVAVTDPRELATAAALSEAVGSDRVISFDHTSPGGEVTRRRVEPWWTGSRGGRWYLVGHDLDRRATRVFRLSRIGGIELATTTRRVPVPSTEIVQQALDHAIGSVNPRLSARIWVAADRAAELRAAADRTAPLELHDRMGDELMVHGHLSELTALVAAQGPDAVALEPPQLRDRVLSVLRTAVEAGR